MRRGAVTARKVSRCFQVYPKQSRTLKEAIVKRDELKPIEVWALRDVSLEIDPGEAVGLIGRNGSGKTTLLRLVAGIFGPTSGQISVGGSVGSLLSLGAGFHPDLTGKENIFLSGSIYGLKRKYIQEQLEEIVAFAELERFIDLPVRTYSSGMFMRLGFSVATHLEADVLLLDEVFAVGDEAFQRKCFGKVFEFRARGGTILFVSHSASAVESLCPRVVFLRDGQVEFDGEASDAIGRYQTSLASEENPAERDAGLREWGSREIHVSSIRLEDASGTERQQFLGGEPLVLRLEITAESVLDPPWLSVELRDQNGALLSASVQDTTALGWDGRAGTRTLTYAIDELPLSDGRFRLAVAVSERPGGSLYHRIDEAASFLVHPDRDHSRGKVRLDGHWNLVGSSTRVRAAG